LFSSPDAAVIANPPSKQGRLAAQPALRFTCARWSHAVTPTQDTNMPNPFHYQATGKGYSIVGSNECFNRALYGGHAHDDRTERFLTFAGDQPLIMGAVSDWRTTESCAQGKCGTFMAGLALTPGLRIPIFYYTGDQDGDRTSQWFHEAEGTVATFRHGWMDYEIRPFAQCFPHVQVCIQVLPLEPDDGFLVHLRITSDQHVNLVMAFGGLTGLLGSLGNRAVAKRLFSPEDCAGNVIALEDGRATIIGPAGPVQTTMQMGASFPVSVSLADARTVALGPGQFLGSGPGRESLVRLNCPLQPGQALDGFVVAIHNPEAGALSRWLAMPDPVNQLKARSRQKHAAIEIATPDPLLNLTIPPAVIALDACWHGNTFYHGAHEYHHPFMGWRSWYGPTVIGWHDRIAHAVRTHAASKVKGAPTAGQTVWNRKDQYHRLQNSSGFIPEYPLDRSTGQLQPRREIFYNMQEIFVDHFLHHLGWTRDLPLAREVFAVMADVLDWEEQTLDPDGDGLYQNWLNTWISDAHAYNGGGCAQASAYNYRANAVMAQLAELLGLEGKQFAGRAEKIHRACQETLWLAEQGVLAEYVDTVGNRLVHPSPELATIYHAIESGLVDPFQAYQLLRFTRTDLRNERATPRGGRLVWSSNWYPQNYSSCGLYAAENAHLAWACFDCGQAQAGQDILRGLIDAHFMGCTPGTVAHCLTGSGFNSGSPDFPDFTSMYLRLIVEGLFGVRFNLLQNEISISPALPAEWPTAWMKAPDLELAYERQGRTEVLKIQCGTPATRILRLPMRASRVEAVLLNGQPCAYRLDPAIGRCVIEVRTEQTGCLELAVTHGKKSIPSLVYPHSVPAGGRWAVAVKGGTIVEYKDPSSALQTPRHRPRRLSGLAAGRPGWHTVFVRCQKDHWDGWLAADFSIVEPAVAAGTPCPAQAFTPVDISPWLNVSLAEIHGQEFLEPRPKGYSIMTRANGRFGWDWNAGGFNSVVVDDARLRQCGGRFATDAGLAFAVAQTGPNAACVSIWENFPEAIAFPLSGRARELAVFLIGVTNPMQSRVENARLEVHYADGGQESVALVNPDNFDDWLNAAVQTQNETVYFSDHNHGLVQRVPLDPARALHSLRVRAVANEVIVGVLAVSICR
jgi:hypothetical protein